MKVIFNNRKVNLPDFLIVGAMKSGTTTIYKWLSSRSDVFFPKKEPRFFVCTESPIYYRNWFWRNELVCSFDDYISMYSKMPNGVIAGDASVCYLHQYDIAIKNIKFFYGTRAKDLKIIIILRNPVDRAISHLVASKKINVINELIKEYKLYERYGFNHRRMINNEILKGNKGSVEEFFFWSSMYSKQVKAYMENFRNVRIYIFERFVKDPRKYYIDLLQFLGLSPKDDYSKLYKKYNEKKGIPNGKIGAYFDKVLLYTLKYLPYQVRELIPYEVRKSFKEVAKKFFYKDFTLSNEEKKKLYLLFEDDIRELERLLNDKLNEWGLN